jgi:hypothetical protein
MTQLEVGFVLYGVTMALGVVLLLRQTGHVLLDAIAAKRRGRAVLHIVAIGVGVLLLAWMGLRVASVPVVERRAAATSMQYSFTIVLFLTLLPGIGSRIYPGPSHIRLMPLVLVFGIAIGMAWLLP